MFNNTLFMNNKVYNYNIFETVHSWLYRNKLSTDTKLLFNSKPLDNKLTFYELGIFNNSTIHETNELNGASSLNRSWWYSFFLPLLLIIIACSGLITIFVLVSTAPISLLPYMLFENKTTSYILSSILQLLIIIMVFYTIFFYISRGILLWGVEHACDKEFSDGTQLGYITRSRTIATIAIGIFGAIWFVVVGGLMVGGLFSQIIETTVERIGNSVFMIFGNMLTPGFFAITTQFLDAMNNMLSSIDKLNKEVPNCSDKIFLSKMIFRLKFFKQIIDQFTNASETIKDIKLEEILDDPFKYLGNIKMNNMGASAEFGEEIIKLKDNYIMKPIISFLHSALNKSIGYYSDIFQKSINLIISKIQMQRDELDKEKDTTSSEWCKYIKNDRSPFLLSFNNLTDFITYLLEFLIGTYCTSSDTIDTLDKYIQENIISVPKIMFQAVLSSIMSVVAVLLIIIFSIIVDVANIGASS